MSYQDDDDRDRLPMSESDRDRYDDRDRDDRDQDDRARSGAPRPPAQSAAKGCSKGCLYGTAGCGCLTLLMFLVMFAVGWRMVNSVSTDPVVIKAATLRMADINPPADLEPKVKMDVILAKAVVYQSADRESTLSLLQIAPWIAQKDANQNQEFGDGFRKNFGDGGADVEPQELKIEKTEVKEVKIRGQISKVRFSEAKTPAGVEFRIVEAEFPGADGPILLQLQRPLKKYDEAEAKQFLESIK